MGRHRIERLPLILQGTYPPTKRLTKSVFALYFFQACHRRMTLFVPSLSPTMPFPMGIILRRSPKNAYKKIVVLKFYAAKSDNRTLKRGSRSWRTIVCQCPDSGLARDSFVPMRRPLLVISDAKPKPIRSSHLKKPNKRMDGIAARHRVQGGGKTSNLISTEHLVSCFASSRMT